MLKTHKLIVKEKKKEKENKREERKIKRMSSQGIENLLIYTLNQIN